MKWEKVDKYHLKSKQGNTIYYISKSFLADKVLYELWEGNKWLYKNDTLEKVKEYAATQTI
jgi:hypothetical protein